MIIFSGVTEFIWGQTFIWVWGGGGEQEDGIAMKDAQSKVKWGGGQWGDHDTPIVTPLIILTLGAPNPLTFK